MHRTHSCLLALVATASLAGCEGKTVDVVAPIGVSPTLQTVLSFVEGQMSTCSIPGGAIAVIQNGVLTDQAGFGARDDDGSPVDPSTLFFTAALSKLVDGVTALRLVEEGKFDTSQPVTRYVPLPLAPDFDPSSITVAELLADTAGLPDLNDSSLSCPVGPGEIGAWFAANAATPLWTPPGAVWNYSQRGMAAAGWAIEEASGQPFETAVASRVFAPAGMTTATYDPSVVTASGDYALGHELSGNIKTVVPGATDCAVTRAADGVYASVLDYAHLAETLLAGGRTMLTTSSVATLEAGQAADWIYSGERYGYGTYAIPSETGHSVLHVEGDMHGYDATLVILPDQGFAVVVFFDAYNPASGCTTDDAARSALSAYLGQDGGSGPDTTPTAADLASYAGTYVDPYVLGTISVAIDAGTTVTATTAAYGTVQLTPISPTAFEGVFGSDHETVIFAPDARGPAAWFVTRLGVGERQP
jgi:CubicO group peptidase (beta-lactamase class C family)